MKTAWILTVACLLNVPNNDGRVQRLPGVDLWSVFESKREAADAALAEYPEAKAKLKKFLENDSELFVTYIDNASELMISSVEVGSPL